MTQQSGPRIIVQDKEHKFFKNLNRIPGDGLELELMNYFILSEHNIHGYEYNIKVEGEDAGTCSMLIESDFNKIAEVGNFGMNIKRKFFGKHLPSKAVKASYKLFKSHGQKSLLITHDEGNNAIQKACEELAGAYLDTFKSKNGRISKRRYIVEIPS